MSSNRKPEAFETENFHDTLSPVKHANFIPNMTKFLLFTFALCSISFVFYWAFSNQSQYYFICPKCEQSIPNHQNTQTNLSHTVNTQTNLSHILFGIAGSVDTWKNRSNYAELWWKPNLTRGFIWLDKNPENSTASPTSIPYRVSEDYSRFKYTNQGGSRSAIRVARVVVESFRLGLDNIRWFVMGDDDTVFFPENLATVLGKYNHNQMYYIGGNSESVEQDVLHSYGMAFGGGGFAVSYGLAVELDRVLDGCIDRYTYLYGSDERISACVDEIGVPLTKDLGFHQVDIRGDPYGLLAAHPVTPLLSLHHITAVEPLFPARNQFDSLKLLMSAYNMDPSRTLQQSLCYDYTRNWSVSVSWGYTAQIYPKLMSAKDLATAFLTFKTWRSWSNEYFTVNTKDLSPEPCDRPITYFLEQVQGTEEGETRSSYKRILNWPGQVCAIDDYLGALLLHHVNVTALKMDPEEWTKAPRRQCCEVVNKTDGDGVLNVKIRTCSPSESIYLSY